MVEACGEEREMGRNRDRREEKGQGIDVEERGKEERLDSGVRG